MSYKTPQPPILSFRDPKEQGVIRRLHERITLLESATNSQSFDSGRVSPVPPKAQLNVTTNPNVVGHAAVRIVNPEFLLSKGNPGRAPIRHWVQASPLPNFSKSVTDFPVSHQNYLPVSELGSGTFYFRLRSTFDGVTFNNPVQSGAVQIP